MNSSLKGSLENNLQKKRPNMFGTSILKNSAKDPFKKDNVQQKNLEPLTISNVV